MRINTNISAINGHRQLQGVDSALSKSLERLSSGLRINRASDDAAGLSVANRLQTQVRGLGEATKNVQNGISLTQVADGGLAVIGDILQRGRELAVQSANGVNTQTDRDALEAEFKQLMAEIDNVASNTTWNDIKLLGGTTFTAADYTAVQNALQNSLMGDAYAVVSSTWGIPITPANTRNMDIYLDEIGTGGVLAYVQGYGSFSPSLQLHVDMYDFVPNSGQGTAPILNDRILAHEFTHAVMFDSTAFNNFPTYFQEGIAEFTQGADERISGDLAALGGDTPANRQALINMVSPSSWGGTSADYSAGNLAVRFLDSKLRAAGLANGLRTATATYMAGNATASMDGLVALAGYANQAAFLADFQGGNGLAWMNANVNLADADTGSATGSDYGGPSKDFNSVVPNGTAGDPTPWIENFQPQQAAGPITIQEGADYGQTMDVGLVTASSSSLGLGTTSIASQGTAMTALDDFDAAIQKVNGFRASFGAAANRLSHTLGSITVGQENQAAAESQIRDTDVSATVAEMTRQQILKNATTAVVAQANSKPAVILSLLE